MENGAQKSPRQLERCGGLLCRVTAGGVAGRNLMSGALNCCFQCFPRAAENKKAHDSPKTVMGFIAGCSVVRTHQGGMLVRTPLVEAKQHGSIGIHDLTPVIMAWSRLGLAEERLVPFEATENVAYADDRPYAFHCY